MFKRINFLNFIAFIFSLIALVGCDLTLPKNEKLQAIFEELFQDIDLHAVESDLDFPSSINDVEITYVSMLPEIVSHEGKVTRGIKDEEVVVNITLKSLEGQLKKKVTIVVLKDLHLFIEDVYSRLFEGEEILEVTENLSFLTALDGVNISYQSDDIELLSNEGVIIRGTEDKIVSVTITLEIDDVKIDKTLQVKILKDDQLLFVNQVYNSLFDDVDLSKVTSDLTFNTFVDGVSISYQSANLNVIKNDGKVTRGLTDLTVRVVIVLTLNDTVLTKEIDITVLQDPMVIINQVFDSLFTNIDLSRVTSNLTFVTSKNGVTITYQSTNTNVITNSGVITRGNNDQQVTVNLTLSYQGVTVPKEILIIVLKKVVVTYPISNAINASNNQSVTVQGIIIAKVGTSYFIHDGNDGIYLYLLGDDYEVGDEVKVTGVKTIFNGLHELKNNTNISVIRSDAPLPSTIFIERLTEIDKQSTLYSINDLVVVDFDQFVSGKDVFITVKDTTNHTIDIFISKNTDDDVLSQIKNQLSGMSVGDILHLQNIVSTYYNRYQLQLCSSDQISIEAEMVVTNPIDQYYPKSEDMRFIWHELDEYLTSGIYPIGEANVLIIPINFTDYMISSTNLARLEKAFFGTSEDTGWESVQSYYAQSSYGKFTFNGEILSPFQTNRPSTYYANLYNNGYDADYEIIKAALSYYDDEIDYSLYDNNDDGYIDGLYFIYATPTWYGDETGSVNDSDLWWAYVYEYFTEDYEYYDGVEANYYLWAGIDFMDEVFTYTDYTDDYIEINAATYIHETGHMLGLYDYYDYDEDMGPDGGLGGADMMDYTVGDHNSFSKIMVDWATPLVVSGKSTIVTIDSFTTSGDVILVSTNWNNSYFDEYFLIELYTPTGLNEGHAGFHGLFDIVGVRIFHVNAQINPDQSDGMLFLYDNSYTDFKVLKLIEADGDNSIERRGIAENDDLFQVGDVFGNSTNYRLTNGLVVNFDIEIISINNNQATIGIEWFN